MQRLQSLGLLCGRTLLALIFIAAGADKLTKYAATKAYMQSAGVPASLLPLVIALELGAGLAIIFGARTRPAACALSAFTIIAALIFHRHFADPVQMVMFMKNLSITGGLLVLASLGPGDMSIDARHRPAVALSTSGRR